MDALIEPKSNDARRLTLDQLRTFVAVAEEGGFQRAGDGLARTQSAVSQTLRRLEQIVGCRLLERRQGRVSGLTAEGRQLLASAREILARTGEALAALKRPDLRGRVRLGLPDDVAPDALTGVIARTAARHPQLQLEVLASLSADLIERFQRQELELVLVKRLVPAPELAGPRRELVREPLLWVHRQRVERGSFASLPLVLFPPGCPYRQAVTETLDALGQPWHGAYVSASYDNLRRAVSAGLGIGVLPAGARAPEHRLLGADEGFPPLPEVRLMLLWREGQPVAALLGEILSEGLRLGGR